MKKPRRQFVLPEKFYTAEPAVHRTKIVVEYQPYIEPPEPRPRECPVCRQERPDWHFQQKLAAVCRPCSDWKVPNELWGALEWKDIMAMSGAFGVIKRIEQEIKNGR